LRKRKSEITRSIEVLARLLNGEVITKQQAADEYGVEEITVSRMLQSYRTNGLEVFGRKSGIKIFIPPQKETLLPLAAEYIAVTLNTESILNSLEKYSKIDEDFFIKVVLITSAVRDQRILSVQYKRLSDNVESGYVLKPYRLTESDGNWILHAVKENESIIKTFYLSRMNSIKVSGKHFKRDVEIEESNKKEKIILRFVPDVEQELYYKIWFDDFSIRKNEDGTIELTTEQIITNRLAAWCISWWDAMEIIEPLVLKEYAKEMIDSYLTKNRTGGE
jgi:predicted DNA-binding transcriptional regulator YafY